MAFHMFNYMHSVFDTLFLRYWSWKYEPYYYLSLSSSVIVVVFSEIKKAICPDRLDYAAVTANTENLSWWRWQRYSRCSWHMMGSPLCHPLSETPGEVESLAGCAVVIAKAEILNVSSWTLTPKVPTYKSYTWFPLIFHWAFPVTWGH